MVLVLLCSALAPGAFGARPARTFFGIQAFEAPDAAGFGRIAQARIGTFRTTLWWSVVERQRGERNWGFFDAQVRDAARSRVAVLPVLNQSPPWVAVPEENAVLRTSADRRAFARFARDAVARYGPGGEFWGANPDLPRRPIRRWQLWNEPNGSLSSCPQSQRKCEPKGKAAVYRRLVEAASRAIKGRDRRAKVGLAGVAETLRGVGVSKYLGQLYAKRDFRRRFAAVAVHPYARDQRGVQGGLERARRIMNRRGHRSGSIWITEVGWGTSGNHPAFSVSKKGQAKRLSATFRLAVGKRQRFRLALVTWFCLRDRSVEDYPPGSWIPHTGLFGRSGRPKPAWSAYLKVTGGSGRGALNASPPAEQGAPPAVPIETHVSAAAVQPSPAPQAGDSSGG